MVEFRDIPSCPGYRAGDDGTIWTCYKNRWGQSDQWRPLIATLNNKYGRRTVRIRHADGRMKTRAVHHLVLESFVGPRPDGFEALHRDGDAGNNVLANLRWGTRAENIADFCRHGRKKGERHPLAKLTDELVISIRARAAAGETQQAIADSIGVRREAIGKVVRRERWLHVG